MFVTSLLSKVSVFGTICRRYETKIAYFTLKLSNSRTLKREHLRPGQRIGKVR